jgi:tRNA 2-selenouridine synthase SelU
VGDFEIPSNVFNAIDNAPCIEIISSFENRIRRIVKDYFGDDNRGVKPMMDIFKEQRKIF